MPWPSDRADRDDPTPIPLLAISRLKAITDRGRIQAHLMRERDLDVLMCPLFLVITIQWCSTFLNIILKHIFHIIRTIQIILIIMMIMMIILILTLIVLILILILIILMLVLVLVVVILTPFFWDLLPV